MRKLAAIMFTDIVGYTALMSRDEATALSLVERNRQLLKPLIRQFHGEWLKELGDGSLSAFSSAVNAVSCALAIQSQLSEDAGMRLRIGIHVGDVVVEEGDVFGDGVNVASRLEPLAEPGGICISERVYEDIRNKRNIAATFVGERKLKGLENPVRVYRIVTGQGPSASEERPVRATRRLPWSWLTVVGVAAVLTVAIVYLTNRPTARFRPARLGEKSVAVLPFENMSPDEEGEYFSDGVTEDILTQLARIGDLTVIARTSIMGYKKTRKRIREIGQELGVAAILEGSVRRYADRVRITGQLVDARTEEHLWAESYDRDLTDIFAVQSEVARAIAAALKATLTTSDSDRLARVPTENPDAYRLYLQGRYYWNKRTPEDLQKGKEYFEKAIELDPLYARAYAGLADVYNLLHIYTGLPGAETYPKARAAALKALEIDGGLGEAHSSLAAALQDYYWDWEGAGREHRRALELSPNYATGRQWYAEYLTRVEDLQEALRQALKAEQLDPLSPVIVWVTSGVYYAMGDTGRADRELDRAIALASDWHPLYTVRALAYEQWGRTDEAVDAWLKSASLQQASEGTLKDLKEAYESAGMRGFWQAYLKLRILPSDPGTVPAFERAMVYAHLGRKDDAFQWLEAAYRERDVAVTYLGAHADLYVPGLKSDPRFRTLLQKIGLER